jgi:signal peptidase
MHIFNRQRKQVAENREEKKGRGRKMKIFNRIVLAILVLILGGLAFIYFMPGYDMYLVRSGSMTPYIKTGDLIITGPVDGPVKGEVKEGTVITYEYSDDLVTHRVQAIEGNVLVTKGDAVEDPDPWEVTMSDVRGVYLFKIPSIGYVTNFIQTKTGWFITIIIPGALLTLWLVKDIVKEAFSEA